MAPVEPVVGTILVATDGSANSADAVRWAASLARCSGAAVVAVHALGLLEQMDPEGSRSPAEPQRDRVEALMTAEWCRPLTDAGIEHRVVLTFGSPVPVILQTATESGADLIVLGSRGHGGATAELLGSTSSQVATRSTRPVLIVPPAGAG